MKVFPSSLERSGTATTKGRTKGRMVSIDKPNQSVAGMMATLLVASVFAIARTLGTRYTFFFSTLLEISYSVAVSASIGISVMFPGNAILVL